MCLFGIEHTILQVRCSVVLIWSPIVLPTTIYPQFGAPKKVFFGQLHADIIKPTFMEWLERMEVAEPVNAYMLPSGKGGATCAFAVFWSPEDALDALRLQGNADPAVTASHVVALRPPPIS